MRPRLTLACLLPLLAACSGGSGPSITDPTPVPAPNRAGFGSDTAFASLMLVSPLKSKNVFLVDLDGETLHTWETEWEPGNSVYLTERGTLYRCMRIEEEVAFSGGGIGGGIQEIAADGTVLWEYRMSDENRHIHHDIEPMPNGNLLLIAWGKRTKQEALEHGRDPELLRGEEFWPDSVYEIRPVGKDDAEIVWEWHSWDHMIQDFDPEAVGYGVIANHPERIDINGDRDPEVMSVEDMDAELDQLAAMGYAGGDDDDPPLGDQRPPHKGDGVNVGDHRPPHGPGPPPGGGPPPHGAGPPPDNQNGPNDGPPSAKEARRAQRRDADWMHTNSIDYNAKLDQIAISVRTFDEVWIIDHSTTTAEASGSTGGHYGKGGDLLYRWGNPSAYDQGTMEDRILFNQHDVQWIEEGLPGAGGFLTFNNGRSRPEGDWSSIEEWWPPQNAAGAYLQEDDGTFGPTTTSWTHTALENTDFFSGFISGTQRLPNGNTHICSGADGKLFEVNPSGKVVWEWECDLVPPKEEGDEDDSRMNPNALFRATRLAVDHPGLEALRAQGIAIP